MKYNLKVGQRVYAVEIENIDTRPVKVRVDGIEFEVTSEMIESVEAPREAGKTGMDPRPMSSIHPPITPVLHENILRAPLPGKVIDILVQVGEKVKTGQVIVVIDAMKMKNSIRAGYGGIVSEVLVSGGQSVAHQQALVKFEDPGEAA
jgi:biotin carboxyl carrier protein